MRIDRIVLKNFRQYRDTTVVFPRADCDLHVILGEGGCGKTTLLNALEWCLYAWEPHLARANSDHKSVPIYNLAAMQDLLTSSSRKDKVQVSVDFSDKEGGQYKVSRVQQVFVDPKGEICYEQSTQPTISVKRNGDRIPKLFSEEAAEEEIEKFMPAEVGKFFFFDGEQLDNFFDRVPDMAKAVENISRVDLINRTLQHLTSFANLKRGEASRQSPDLARIDTEIKELEAELEQLTESLKTKTDESTKAREEIRRLTEIIQGRESLVKFEDQRRHTLADISRLEGEAVALKQDRQHFVRRYITAFNLFPGMMRVHKYIQKAKDADQLPPPIDKALLEQYLKNGVCGVCGHPLDAKAQGKIEKLYEMLRVGTKVSHRLTEMDVSISHYIDIVRDYPVTLETLRQRQIALETKRQESERRLNEADEFLAKIGDTEKIREAIEQRAQFENIESRLRDDIPVLKYHIEEGEKKLAETHAEYDRAIAQVKGLKDAKRRLDFLDTALTALESVRKEMVEEVRSGIETETNDRLGSLMWKPEYGTFTLSEQYSADLIQRHESSKITYSILSTRSMGERNILANAFTLALHRVSGFESFLCVDTPVARLSPEFRKRVAATWAEMSRGCQLVFFLTQSEYKGEMEEGFAGHLASLGKIEYNNYVSQVKEVR